MEEQILRFYLKVSSFLLIPIIYFLYFFFIKEINLKNEYIFVKKNDNYENIIKENIVDNKINQFIYKLSLKVFIYSNKNIHYGRFYFNKKNNFINFIKILTSPSKYYEKITVVEGSSKYQLNNILSKNFDVFEEIPYIEIIADSYLFSPGSSFKDFKKKLNERYLSIKQKYKNNKLLEKYSFDEIIIIGSLIEKEGLDYNDKRKIFSVIDNRLSINMKLQIDATVIYAITKGIKNLSRKLTYRDLEINSPYNTYKIYGLPPKPISYVSYKTIELIFENYKTDYLYYF